MIVQTSKLTYKLFFCFGQTNLGNYTTTCKAIISDTASGSEKGTFSETVICDFRDTSSKYIGKLMAMKKLLRRFLKFKEIDNVEYKLFLIEFNKCYARQFKIYSEDNRVELRVKNVIKKLQKITHMKFDVNIKQLIKESR